MPIPVIFCIDVEPDDRLVRRDGAGAWAGYEESIPWLGDLRSRLESATGNPVHYSWLYRLDPQVEMCFGTAHWPLSHYHRMTEVLVAAGDELGLHPHAWRWDEAAQTWIADHGNQSWVEHCLDVCIDAYAEVMGRTPATMRHGDKFYSEALSRHAERRGLQYDLTLEPGTDAAPAIVTDGSEHFTGQLADFRDVPRYPYRRSAEDWKVADPDRTDGLWMIPLSAGIPESPMGAIARRMKRWLGRASAAPKPMTLNASRHWPTLGRIVEQQLNGNTRPYLGFVIRASDATDSVKRGNVEGILAYLQRHKRAREFTFSTPGEAVQYLGVSGNEGLN